MVASMTAFGDTSPEAVDMMREALRELYGVEGSLIEQYFAYWRRMLVLDFGPSLSAFPTPVSVLIARALPWTIGLLFTCTLLAWVLGNLLGGLSGYYRKSRTLGLLGVVAMALPPGALLHHRLHPAPDLRLPLAGAADQRRRGAEHRARASRSTYIGSVLLHSILPALSIILVGIGGWFLGMRALVSNIVTEDYVTYAELAGVSRRRILPFYVMRNALVPQITGLAMSLGAIFNGAIIVEQVFSYPGPRPAADRRGLFGRLQPRARRHRHLDHRGRGVGVPDRHPLPAVRSADAAGMTLPRRRPRPAALQSRSSPSARS